MFCKYCGSKIDADSTFCSRCGKPLSGGGTSPRRSSRPAAGVASSGSVKNLLFLIFAAALLVPLVYAEYRRLVLGAFDVIYWLLAAPALLSGFFMYQVFGAPAVAEEKQKQEEARARGELYDSNKITTVRCNALSICCVIIAAVAFGSSIIIGMIF